jgi:nucleoside-diphosphate-sugar epimerase
MSKVLLIGGPGNISTSTVEELLKLNWEVAIFTLPASPSGKLEGTVKFYRGDRNNPEEVQEALSDFRPEVTADVCCFTPDQARALVPLLRGKVEKHVFVSTVDIYGYPLTKIPYAEDDPRNKPVSQYASDKLECEKLFWAEHAKDHLCISVARPSYSFGPSFVLNFFSRQGGLELLSRLRSGKPVVIPGDGAGLMHPCSAYNTGRMLASIVAAPNTGGEDFTCAHVTYMSQDEYYRLFAEALAVEPRFVYIPKDLLLPLENKLIPDDLLSELTRFNIAFSVNKFKRFFPEFRWSKSLEQAAAEYVSYHDEHGNIPDCQDGYEDRLISAWQDLKKRFNP